jgi:hypothetical protein
MVISASGQIARIAFVLEKGIDAVLEAHLEKTAFDFTQGNKKQLSLCFF